MALYRSPFYFHRWLVEQHFGCQKTEYTAKKTRHEPGVTVQLAGKFYRVETWAERWAICKADLASTDAAYDIEPVLAVKLLEGAETRPGFMDRLNTELEANGHPSFIAERKASLANISLISVGMGMPFWNGVASQDRHILAASLSTLSQMEGLEATALRLADLSFAHGQALALNEESLVVRGQLDGVELLLFRDR